MAETTTIQIQLTREQALQIAAATGLLVGTLELAVEELAEGGVALAQIPEAVLDRPLDLAVDSQANLFLVDSLNGRVRRVDREGVITTVFDSGEERGAASARHYPARVAVDAAGHLLVADPFSHRVFTVSGVATPAHRDRRLDP